MNRRDWQRRALGAHLRLVMEGGPTDAQARYAVDRTPVRSPLDVVAAMQPLVDAQTAEVIWIIALDSQHRMIGNAPIEITRGVLNSSLLHPREVFRAAIVAGAAAVILCHNHPSDDVTPSADDRVVTEQIVAAGRLLDIPVHDHLVLGHLGKYSSFAQAGLL